MADVAAGFTGASAALGVIREENAWIQQRISAGQLTVEPQAADSAAAVYEREASEADQLADSAGCSPDGIADDSSETTGAKPSGEVLAGVDPCDLLSDEELKSFGLETRGESRSELPWAPGCYYAGEPVTVRLEKNTRQTVASSEKRSVWAKFDRTQVNGRAAASAVPNGATEARACVLMFDAEQGLIQVQTQEIRLPEDVDECAKALEIAEKVEPNVPEPA